MSGKASRRAKWVSSGSAGSSVVPTTLTWNWRNNEQAEIVPEASWALAVSQTSRAVDSERRPSHPKMRRNSRCVQW